MENAPKRQRDDRVSHTFPTPSGSRNKRSYPLAQPIEAYRLMPLKAFVENATDMALFPRMILGILSTVKDKLEEKGIIKERRVKTRNPGSKTNAL